MSEETRTVDLNAPAKDDAAMVTEEVKEEVKEEVASMEVEKKKKEEIKEEKKEKEEEKEEEPAIDPPLLFLKAKQAIKANDLDQAEQLLSSALATQVQRFGDVSIECVEYYRAYAEVLLQMERSNLGGFGGGEKKEVGEEEEESDLQVAWENMEMARAILQTQIDSSSSSSSSSAPTPEQIRKWKDELIDVRTTLGEIHLEGENGVSANEEFGGCLKLLEERAKEEEEEEKRLKKKRMEGQRQMAAICFLNAMALRESDISQALVSGQRAKDIMVDVMKVHFFFFFFFFFFIFFIFFFSSSFD